MPGYTCFWHPVENRDSSLNDACPDCGLKYSYPLENLPKTIGGYEIQKAVGRGFYSVAYAARDTQLDREVVLKVIPKKVYAHFEKDFIEECKQHVRVARNAKHIVGFLTSFDSQVAFSNRKLDCHVAVLEYVKGEPLSSYLEGKEHLPPETLAQLTIDLFSLLAELQKANVKHNDLHDGNILVGTTGQPSGKHDAIDSEHRVVAIDLGSTDEKSQSTSIRYGDLHRICTHLLRLAEPAICEPQNADPLEYRISLEISRIAQLHLPDATAQRPISPEECVDRIRLAWSGTPQPWREKLVLERLSDTYNAQTLAPWDVPALLVDPDDWISEISGTGPVILTGMRGCGKTILLRSLEAHARLAAKASEKLPLGSHRSDPYVGFFVSCTRLLSRPGEQTKIHQPVAKLLVAYALETLAVLEHAEHRLPGSTEPDAKQILWEAVEQCVSLGPETADSNASVPVEHRLERVLIRLQREEKDIGCSMSPALAMEILAKAIKRCCKLWRTRTVFFLLDDASTRFLPLGAVKELIFSHLLAYQGREYSFKMTTEEQTFQAVLRSLGNIENARAGRDYIWFDLGQRVLGSLKGSKGKEFIVSILKNRISHLKKQPPVTDPKQVLGDIPLEQIAKNIVKAQKSSPSLKAAYWGLSALVGVCVGDIGDVVMLYQRILERGSGQPVPVDPQIQTDCFQDMCSSRLFELNRRKADLSTYALAFAEASHNLMRASATKVRKSSGRGDRLRQYSSIYIRITSGDEKQRDKQFQQILELIDAGVFVFAGGPSGPRTKTRDQDPTKQFKLAFRKVLGMSSYVGLADSDRFELSGKQLATWLKSPSSQILMAGEGSSAKERSKTSQDAESNEAASLSAVQVMDDKSATRGSRLLFDNRLLLPSSEADERKVVPDTAIRPEESAMRSLVPSVSCECLDLKDLRKTSIASVVTSMGFEERTVSSLQRVLSRVSPQEVILVEYDNPGRRDEVLQLVKNADAKVRRVQAKQLLKTLDSVRHPVIVDITTLAKPLLFTAISRLLQLHGECFVLYTNAQSATPNEAQIQAAIAKVKSSYELLDEVRAAGSGESDVYRVQPLLPHDDVPSRRRILVGFASARPNRLMSFLDWREYEKVIVVTASNDSTPGRRRLIAAGGDVVASSYGAEVVQLESAGVASTYSFLMKTYEEWFVKGTHEVEIALTGTKLQAVAASLASTVVRLAQVWYVEPESVDTERYTRGTGESRVYHLTLDRKPGGSS